MFGMLFTMIPWFIIVAPQIMYFHTTEILANKIAQPIGILIISGCIVWHVGYYLRAFGLRALRYGFGALIISVLGSIPFFIFSSLTRRHRTGGIIESIKDLANNNQNEFFSVALMCGLIFGALIFIGSVFGAVLGKKHSG